MNVNFSGNHTKMGTADSQLLLALTGPKAFIKERLKELLASLDGPYGKPCQGISLYVKGTQDIITPQWEGKKY